MHSAFRSFACRSFSLRSFSLRRVVGVVGALLAASSSVAFAQDAYPNRPITLVSAFPPGGVVDTTARPLAVALQKVFNQPVIIQNRPGAAGMIGNTSVANAPPDGYTILAGLSSISTIPESEKLYDRKPTYTIESFAPIALVSADPIYLAVRTDSPWNTLAELTAAAKAKPGALNFSSSGIYGATHVPMEMYLLAAGAKMFHIPTSGGGPAITALVAGQVDVTMGGPPALVGQVRGGKLRLLAGMGAKRHETLPDVPTMKELGLDAEYLIWVGLMVPVATPEPIQRYLRDATAKAVKDPDFVATMRKLNTPIQYLDAPEFKKFWDADAKRLATVVQAIGKVGDK
jgi:tripartite-type tricarboxylate transporter receptor subunit TctC